MLLLFAFSVREQLRDNSVLEWLFSLDLGHGVQAATSGTEINVFFAESGLGEKVR